MVGDLLWAENPTGEVDYTLGVDVEPETWRWLKLVAPKRAGGWAYVELNRPLWWLEERNAQVGGRIDINVLECGIDGHAKLLYIGPCPPIEHDPTGRRRVITGTFHHHAADILDLRLANLTEPIGTTPAHPFWSEDRQDFITAGNLRAGETLRVFGSTTRVTSITPRNSPEAVYNLEVHLDHVYHVTGNGVLVHNAIQCDVTGIAPRVAGLTSTQVTTHARTYADLINSNTSFTWKSKFGKLTQGQQSAIRSRARASGLINDLDKVRRFGPNNVYADFSEVAFKFSGETTVKLPRSMWKKGRNTHFDYLNKKYFGGRGQGTSRLDLAPHAI